MADEQNTNNVPKKKERGLIGYILGTLLVSLFLSIIVEWIGIAFFWPELGAQHAQQVMLNEFSWFSDEFQRSLLHSSPVALAEQAIAFVHEWLFVKTGIQVWLNSPPHQAAQPMSLENLSFDNIAAYFYYYTRAYIESALYVIITFIVRVMIIGLTSPLFLLAALVGFVDGLVQRDLRRFGVGRESAFKYHYAKNMVFPSMIVAWIIYLSVPFSIHPNIILIPAAALFGLMISLTSGNFKKYL